MYTSTKFIKLASSILLIGSVIAAVSVTYAQKFPAVVEAQIVATMSAETEGILENFTVTPGESVSKGHLLSRVRVRDLMSDLTQLEAREKYFQFQNENLSELNKSGLATDEELEALRMEADINVAQLNQVRFRISKAEVLAPFDGNVTEVFANAHEWVQLGQPLVKMYDVNSLHIVADLPTEVALKLDKKTKVPLHLKIINEALSAKFIKIVPEVAVKSNTVKTYWELDDDFKKYPSLQFLPGMRLTLDVQVP